VLLVAYFGFFYNVGAVSVLDNFGDTGGSPWVPFTGNFTTTTGTYQQPYGGWYRVIGAKASAGTAGVGASNWGGGNQSLCVDQVTSSSGTVSVPHNNAVPASYSATGAVGLGSAPAASSMVWSAAGCGESALTPVVTNTGFTQLDLLQTWSSQATAYENTSGPGTVAWSGLSAGQVNALIACEVAEAPMVANQSSALIGFFP
jgi:hypothetical protein